jgi:hypothetical protein
MHSYCVMGKDEECVPNQVVRLIVKLKLRARLKLYGEVDGRLMKNAWHDWLEPRQLSRMPHCGELS